MSESQPPQPSPQPEGPPALPELEAIGKACFALHARMTARLLSRAYEAALRPLGLKIPQFGILGSIAHGAMVSETALADSLGLERTTLVRNLKTLSDKGWIEPAPGDGRGQRHRLSPAGQAVLEAAIPLWEQAQREVEGRLVGQSPDEIRSSMRALRKAAR
jgi:DNA-binding MarR family transcriptional regulator